MRATGVARAAPAVGGRESVGDGGALRAASRVGRPPASVPPMQAFSEFMRAAPVHAKTAEELQAEAMEKQSMLTDLERLRDHHGIAMTRVWSMDDDYDDMAFELKRLMLHVDEVNNIASMRSGLQLACTGIEMLSKRFNLLDLDGWSAEVCRDMGKHDRALGRMYALLAPLAQQQPRGGDRSLARVVDGHVPRAQGMSKRMFRGRPRPFRGRAPSRSRPRASTRRRTTTTRRNCPVKSVCRAAAERPRYFFVVV